MYQTYFLFALVLLQLDDSLGIPKVVLPDGPLIGSEAYTYTNKTYYSFKKIPFASPPVGKLRFQPPIKPQKWTTPLVATNSDADCFTIQTNSRYETEDCLYLNVFTPQLPAEGQNVSLPVMMFIHGGGFIGGTGRSWNSGRIINEDIILVVLNYRLGPFGFISTLDEVIPGNNGLKDQQFAIQWVHDNIEFFGGDPNKVTIFGQSAGSASCSYHLLNQKNRGLFAGAILQSGAAISPWAFQRRSREIAFATAALLNDTFNTNNNSKDLLDFLLTVDAKALDLASEKYNKIADTPDNREVLQGYYWTPVVEVKNPDAFLTRKMLPLLEAGNVVGVPLLSGMTSEEDIFYYRDTSGLMSDLTIYDSHLDWLVPDDMGVTDKAERTRVGRVIRDMYTHGEPLFDHPGDAVRLFSDTSFTRSIIKQAELYSKVAKNYFYQYSYDGTVMKLGVYYDGAESVGHNAELSYILCGDNDYCSFSLFPDEDQLNEERLIKIWTNFAKYQNPTPEKTDVLQNITWPLVNTTSGDFYYVDIGEDLQIKNHPKEVTYAKWVALYDSLDSATFDTY